MNHTRQSYKEKPINGITLLSILIIVIAIFLLKSTNEILVFGAEEVSIEFENYFVKDGDTLWDLSSEYTSAKNRMEWIAFVSEINQIQDYVIHPGQQLHIPVE